MKVVDLVNEGKELYDKGEIEESIKKYDEALKIYNKSKEAYYNKGVSLEQLGKYEEALESYKKATEIDDKFSDAYAGQGDCEAQLGNFHYYQYYYF